MKNAVEGSSVRQTTFSVDKFFLDRWSPRAMTGESIPREELMSLFEAARWAPSSSNEQPWRFVYALRDTKEWDLLFDLMVDFNKSWTKNAAALVVVISKKISNHSGKPILTHSYDTGAAWENFALQGVLKGFVVHGMGGFDYEKAQATLKIPEHFQVEAMAAVGRPAKKETLPPALQERETPSNRRPLNATVFEGVFAGE